ncbi:6509_t:CDS:1 [Funneliformis geosporum]|uniref:1184_t:CDS:1 n=1 Tax=Funneliformis geosporum TaxID=1117311 RepID=A0A9W4X2M0_9GLOM|nr:1184_t:CDS:1 [Funneliformis geosporum]CAI2181974.1 6509_t:CDS:1 [Funneliformis geosporum]
MSKTKTIIAIITVGISLGILLLSLTGAKDGLNIPQDNGTHTGFPAWHPPLKGYNDESLEATIIFSAFVMAICAYFSFKWTSQVPEEFKTYFIDKNINKTPTTEFDRLIAWYATITSLTGIAYFLFDVGKMWVTTGVLHNAIEVMILFAIHQGGSVKSSSFPAWIILYVLITSALSLYLSWPADALWFKMQGLVLDYFLAIQFARIFFGSCKGIGDEGHRLFDAENPGRTTIIRDSNTSENDVIVDDKSVGYFRPRYTLLLFFADFAHIFGNVYVTIWAFEVHSYILFSFTYCITFPLYTYFIYLDTHTVAMRPAQKYIVVPDADKLNVILVILSAIFLSFLTAKISMDHDN